MPRKIFQRFCALAFAHPWVNVFLMSQTSTEFLLSNIISSLFSYLSLSSSTYKFLGNLEFCVSLCVPCLCLLSIVSSVYHCAWYQFWCMIHGKLWMHVCLISGKLYLRKLGACGSKEWEMRCHACFFWALVSISAPVWSPWGGKAWISAPDTWVYQTQ